MISRHDYKILHHVDENGFYSKICEELAELQVAVLHHRDHKANDHDLAEEIADVMLQLEKLTMLVDEKLIVDIYNKKMNYLKDYINKIDPDHARGREFEDL